MSGPFDRLGKELRLAADLGRDYVRDSLKADAQGPSELDVHARLDDPSAYGRGPLGWTVKGGIPACEAYAVLRNRAPLGNRSLYARLSFCSTQQGVASGQHGKYEIRMLRGANDYALPLSIRADNGTFCISDMTEDNIIAGSGEEIVYRQSRGAALTIEVLLFAKGIYARLSGSGVAGGAREIGVADNERPNPGLPAFGVRANERAAGGEAVVFDWFVSPVGPFRCPLGVIGDSLTAGPGGEPEAESYAAIVAAGLGQKHILNVGGGGSTTAADAVRFAYEIAPFRPKIVWIEGGTNDIARGTPAGIIFENMKRQAGMIDWGGQAVLSTVPPRLLQEERHYAELFRLNELIRADGLPYVDRYAAVVGGGDLRKIAAEYAHPDGVHINRAGNQRIAEHAAAVIGRLADGGRSEER